HPLCGGAGANTVARIGAASAPASIAVLILIRMSTTWPPLVRRPAVETAGRHFRLHLAGDGHRVGGADLVKRDRAGRSDLLHEVLVPLALHLDVGAGAELDRLDQVVVDVGVDAGFAESVERGAGRAAANEPGLKVLLRRIVELAGLPDIVAMPANQMRPGIAVGLRMYEHDGLADLRGHRVL